MADVATMPKVEVVTPLYPPPFERFVQAPPATLTCH